MSFISNLFDVSVCHRILLWFLNALQQCWAFINFYTEMMTLIILILFMCCRHWKFVPSSQSWSHSRTTWDMKTVWSYVTISWRDWTGCCIPGAGTFNNVVLDVLAFSALTLLVGPLGGRKGIRLVKNWVVRCWHGYLSGAMCIFAYGPADTTAAHCLLLQ